MAAGLLSGGAAGVLLLAPSLAGAAGPLAGAFGQTTPPTTEPADDGAADATADAESTADENVLVLEPGDQLRELLQPLVDDGTITAEQLDAVVESVESAAPDVFIAGPPQIFEGAPGRRGRPDWPFPDVPFPGVMGGHGGPGFPGGGIEIHAGEPGIAVEIGDGIGRGRFGAAALDLVANTIGISAPDLVDQLADGSTVADVATAAGADPQAVIDALVADTQERLAAAVQSGRITQAEADERLEDATERITDFVNGEGRSSDDESADAGTQESTDSDSTATTETTSA